MLTTCPRCWAPCPPDTDCDNCSLHTPAHPHPWDRIVSALSPLTSQGLGWQKVTAPGTLTNANNGLVLFQHVPGVELRYGGFATVETTGAAAAGFSLRDGEDSSLSTIEHVALSAGQSAREFYGPDGDIVQSGEIRIGGITGALRLVIRIKVL